jgi:hypothetical protein
MERLVILACYGSREQLRTENKPVDITVSEMDGKRIVGCVHLGTNGMCNAPGTVNTEMRISRLNCPHLFPIREEDM